jgi:hypothetical protein
MVEITQLDTNGDDVKDNNDDDCLIIVQCESNDSKRIKTLIQDTLRKNRKAKSTAPNTWKSWLQSLFTRENLENEWAELCDVFRFRLYDVLIVICIAYLCKKFSILKPLLGWLVDE